MYRNLKKTFISTLLLFLFSISAIAQSRTVTGRITDQATGQPITGVNVSVKGGTTTVVTDANGSYSITVPSAQSTLVFSYVGYGTQELTVGTNTTLSPALSSTQRSMDEVVVIGYGTIKRRDLTGSVASVKAADIVRTPTANPLEAIQGRVTGVDITRSSGAAGGGVNIRVRGNRSINGNNNPLYIIDGFQGGNPSDINTNDIESIEVLKDASATAIYGSQGANGVIIITTKKGVAGRTRVNYDGYYGTNGYTAFPQLRLREDYIQLRREAYRATGDWASPADDPKIFPNSAEYAAVQAGDWIDWYDLINRNGRQQSHNVSVRSGNERTKAFLSLGYFKEEGMLRRNDFTRYTVRFNLDQTITNWAKTGLQTQIAYFDQNNRQDPLSVVLSTSPLGKAYDAAGNINLYPVAGNNSVVSPLTDERGDTVSKNNVLRTSIISNAFVEIAPIKGLTFRSNFGVNVNFSRQGIFNSSTSLAQRSTRITTASQSTAFSRGFNWDNVLTYNRKFGDHDVTVTALQQYIQSDLDNLGGSGTNQLLGSQLFYNLGATTGNRNPSSGYISSNLLSYAGRIHYTYKGKYLLTLTQRADGASRLATGNKWDYFPSAAVGWNISDEKFMDNMKVINNLKLRASYGVTGNYGIEVYGTQSGLASSNNIGFGDVQVTQYQFLARVGNPELQWEKTATTNVGLEFTLLNNRFNGTFEFYNAVTNDVILDRRLPLSSGLGTSGSVYQNVGRTVNKGIEISLTSQNFRGSNFNWSTTATFTRNKERITDLINGTDIISTTSPETGSLLLNRPLSSFYYYKKLGIWQTNEQKQASELRVGTYRFQPGDIKLQDLNGDSLIDTRDRMYLGSAVPDFILGLQNTFSFKGFDLGIFVVARYGQMINAEFLGRYNPSGEGSGPADFNYWTPENPTNDYPRPRRLSTLSSYQGYTGYLALNYVEGSFIKIKTINLGYTLPKRIANKIHSDNIRFYATANNVFTFAKSHLLKNYDPERGGAESSPLSRQFVFGVNLGF